MDTYELERSKGKYKDLKENVNRMLNILSSTDAVDNISRARTYLKEYYFVNNIPYSYAELGNEKRRLEDTISNLSKIVNSIDNKISSISDDIDEARAKEEEEKKDR